MKKKDYDSISAAEAARMLNEPPQMIRQHLILGNREYSHLGWIENKGKSRNTYKCSRRKIEKYLRENS